MTKEEKRAKNKPVTGVLKLVDVQVSVEATGKVKPADTDNRVTLKG